MKTKAIVAMLLTSYLASMLAIADNLRGCTTDNIRRSAVSGIFPRPPEREVNILALIVVRALVPLALAILSIALLKESGHRLWKKN